MFAINELSTNKELKAKGINFSNNATNQNYVLNGMKETLLDTRQQYQEKKNTLESRLKSYSPQLLSDIHGWEQTYVLMAPVDGEMTFTTYWVENQNVVTGDVVFTIIQSENETLLGRASFPVDRSGKIKVRQKVNIRFYNFPDNELGIVKGVVETISVVPAKTNQKELPEMQAQADIIMEEFGSAKVLYAVKEDLEGGNEGVESLITTNIHRVNRILFLLSFQGRNLNSVSKQLSLYYR